ncbi:hypothetical protein P8452_52110 [Trifolium repens]|nr:hypothetical protein P8452_52110 [Trifolium repens]
MVPKLGVFCFFYLEIEFDTPKMLPNLHNTQASCTPTTCTISLVVLMIVYLNIISAPECSTPPQFCLGVSKLFQFRSVWFGGGGQRGCHDSLDGFQVKYFVEERCRRRLLVEWQRPPFAEVYLTVGLASKGLGYKEKAISLFKLEFHSKQLVLN